MYSSVLVLFIFIFLLFFLNNKLLTTILFVPIFLYFITYDIRNSVEVRNLQVFKKISSYNNYLIYGIIILFTITLLLILDNELSVKYKNINRKFVTFKKNRLKFVFYLISFLSIAGTIINLSHVNFSFVLLLDNPREYELTFGSSTAINYLYFLSPIGICIYLYLRQSNHNVYFGKIIVFFLLISSFLHGVKFTVFDTILIPTLFYFYLNNGQIKFKTSLYIISILLIFYLSFSTFIRGSEDSDKTPADQVLSYVLPNYINLAYSLDQKIFQWDGFSILVPDKSPSIFDKYYVVSEGGFVLNDAYNMETAYISYYRFAWYFGPLLFLLPILLCRRYLLNFSNFNFLNIFLIAMIDFCLIFTFFFHAFVKIKYWYFILVVLILNIFIRNKVLNKNK